jgi:hypothetical protein
LALLAAAELMNWIMFPSGVPAIVTREVLGRNDGRKQRLAPA